MDKIIKLNKELSSYLPKANMNQIEELAKAIKEEKTILTCVGLYNHGKSSLLNILVDDFEEKTFKVADIRETVKSKGVLHNGILYTDTPGLNAQENDDKRVYEAIKKSDINIFVHNINTGEFVAKEIEFLNKVKKHWKDADDFIKRTFFVLTKTDDCLEDEYIQTTTAKMSKQIKEIFGVEAVFFAVSAKDYAEGKKNKEDELIEISNIDILKENINTFIENQKEVLSKTKKDRLSAIYKKYLKENNDSLQRKKLELTLLKKEEQKRKSALKKDLDTFEKVLKQKYQKLREI